MKILLLGSGGRECALAWKLAQSKRLKGLWIAPGNAGTALYGKNVPLAETDFQGIKRLILENDIEMLVVGPELPLANGIADFIRNDGLMDHVMVIGPSKQGAMLESSKNFAKAFMNRNKIPTAGYKSFKRSEIEDGYAFLNELKPPYVLKADGLAAGKGVLICQTLAEAKNHLREMLVDGSFGEASECVVIEEFLQGIELSVFVITDGKNYLILPNAKDYKRIGEGDTGLNTGGMGSVSPVPFADKAFMDKIEQRIIIPTIEGIKKEEIDYCGFIFFGLINCAGNPYVIEYNVRLGDPETEAMIPRIESDLIELLENTARCNLQDQRIIISEKSTVAVMLVSGGYPGSYEKGKEIQGLENLGNCMVFHAGTSLASNGEILTNGGRVLAVTTTGSNLEDARNAAYAEAGKISFAGMYYRKDIGKDLLDR